MNRDVCGSCFAPAALCACVPAKSLGSIQHAWRVLAGAAERLDLPAAPSAAVACLAWLLTRPERQSMVKHYLRAVGVGETTATRVMDSLREQGWAKVQKHTDGRVVRLAPSKKLLALVDQLGAP
jgi:hypothetical protein